MEEKASNVARKKSESQNLNISSESLLGKIKSRQTPELVLALCGALGSGVSTVSAEFKEIIKGMNYKSVEIIKMSEFIVSLLRKLKKPLDQKILDDPADRIKALQNAGNELRLEYGHNILAQEAIAEIVVRREEFKKKQINNKQDEQEVKSEDEIVEDPLRVAWIIEGLKHPEEVELLRVIYKDMFYLFGVLCPEKIRLDRLAREKSIDEGKGMELIKIDESEEEKNGQQLIHTLQKADFFINNSEANINNIEISLKRFIGIIFGENISPTSHEKAMYFAKSASLSSSCLSRQVGASIFSDEGDFISIGCNDVPKYGGGLYSCDDGVNDNRCLNRYNRSCKNSEEKQKKKDVFQKEISEGFSSLLSDSSGKMEPATIKERVNKLAESLYFKAGLGEITEYSRSVHAEMDAIVAAARMPHARIVGGSMYCTTFPCHNCAKHIVSAGIKKVFYIEPYEKSKALELHNDAISFEQFDNNKVCFLPFHGVSPEKYMELFREHGKRKVEGRAVSLDKAKSFPVLEKLLGNYTDFESKVIANLKEQGLTL